MPDLVSIGSLNGCDEDAYGGLEVIYIQELKYMEFSTCAYSPSLNKLTAFTLASGYSWLSIVLPDSSNSYFNERFTYDNRRVIQEGVAQLSSDSVNPGLDILKDKQDLVVVYVYKSGKAFVQGVRKIFFESNIKIVPSILPTVPTIIDRNSGTTSGNLESTITFRSVDTDYALEVDPTLFS